jgi:hypothetical protein
VASVIRVLRTVQPTKLRYLGLSARDGTAEEWAELTNVLTRPCFAQLDTLSVRIHLSVDVRALALDALSPLEKLAAFRLKT